MGVGVSVRVGARVRARVRVRVRVGARVRARARARRTLVVPLVAQAVHFWSTPTGSVVLDLVAVLEGDPGGERRGVEGLSVVLLLASGMEKGG